MVSRNNVASMIIEGNVGAQKQNPRKMQGCCRYIESSMQNLDFIALHRGYVYYYVNLNTLMACDWMQHL